VDHISRSVKWWTWKSSSERSPTETNVRVRSSELLECSGSFELNAGLFAGSTAVAVMTLFREKPYFVMAERSSHKTGLKNSN
jgi:hypothetical protein